MPANEDIRGKLRQLASPLICAVLVLFLLKPYNRARIELSHDDYALVDQSDSPSYVTDYQGVIDFVSDSFAQAELTIHRQEVLHIKAYGKNANAATLYIYVNGYVEDSMQIGTSSSSTKVKVLKNDYVKLKLLGAGQVAAVKLQRGNASTQLSIYGLILLTFLIVWLTGGRLSLLDQLIPVVWLLTLLYNERLFEAVDWFIPMSGFVLIFGAIAYLKQVIHSIATKWLSIALLAFVDLVLAFTAVINGGFIWNFKRFGTTIDYDSVVAFLQSNLSEVLEFGSNELGWIFWATLIIALATPIAIQFLSRNLRTQRKWVPLMVFLVLGIGLVNQSKYVQTFYEGYVDYYAEIAKFNKVQQRFKQPQNIAASKKQQGETYVVVLGESQSKEHMSLYGYFRPTTPYLDALSTNPDQFYAFQNAYSSHTHTILVLQHALTQANQYNGLKYTEVPSLMNVLNAADFKTVWLSNQVKLSNWDNVVSAIAAGCDKEIYINRNIGEKIDGGPVDEELLPVLQKELSADPTQNKVIFVHLMGNHGRYDQRYPESFSTLPSVGKGFYGGQASPEMWAAYDNSIRYNDSICNEIIQMLDASQASSKALVYMADHGEDLAQGRGHNAGQFTYRMTQIPLFVWLGTDYSERYPQKTEQLRVATGKTWSSDMFYDLVLDLTDVASDFRSPQYNVLSSEFNIDNYKTKAGDKDYFAPENDYVWTDSNVRQAQQLKTKIGAHRVNSIAKLEEAVNSGCTVIELDLKINEAGVVEVGHGEEGVMSGIDVQTFLGAIDLNALDMVWFDVKNLDETNVEELIDALNRLNISRDKILVETTRTDLYLSRIRQAGYRLSYYLSTGMLAGPEAEQIEYMKFVNRVLRQGIFNEISFDVAFYENVIKGISEGTRVKLSMHAWDVSLNMRNGNFLRQLNEKNYMEEGRLETLLVSFPSVFDL